MKIWFTKNYHYLYCVLVIMISIVFYYISVTSLSSRIPINELMIFKKWSFFFLGLLLSLSVSLVYWVRNHLIQFTERMTYLTNGLMNQETDLIFYPNEETLLSKVESQLQQLMELMQQRTLESQEEKEAIQTLIADISHQIKTPLANVVMYNETLLTRELEPTQVSFCLEQMKAQLVKLEFLIQSLIKMSRFENGVIQLYQTKNKIHQTIANALSGIYLKAEEKQINLQVECEAQLEAYFDAKWTSEALFNLIENAVKYTPEQGCVTIRVEPLELFTKIEIQDTGIGIEAAEIHQVFKRFYRSVTVSHLEGIGVGLYLSQEIMMQQGGYIKVTSKPGIGSTFSVYIRNQFM